MFARLNAEGNHSFFQAARLQSDGNRLKSILLPTLLIWRPLLSIGVPFS